MAIWLVDRIFRAHIGYVPIPKRAGDAPVEEFSSKWLVRNTDDDGRRLGNPQRYGSIPKTCGEEPQPIANQTW
jgi:hypothetical protein